MLEKTPTGRIDWIDVAKGISIFFVVFYHIFCESKAIANLFNVPAFLFISGYLFRPDNRLGHYFKKKGANLFVPYITFMVVMVFPLEFVFMSDASYTSIVKRLVRDVLSGDNIGVPATTFWFIPCIFVTQQIYNYISVKFNFQKVNIFVYLSLLMAYGYTYFFQEICLPGRLQATLFMLPIFHMGFLFKQRFEELLNTKGRIAAVIIVACVTLIIFQYFSDYDIHKLDMAQNSLGIPLVTFAGCIVAILFVVYLSQWISKWHGLFYHSLAYLGQASLVIMLTHQPIQYALGRYLGMGGVRIIAAILVPVLLFYVLNRFGVSRRFFLGLRGIK